MLLYNPWLEDSLIMPKKKTKPLIVDCTEMHLTCASFIYQYIVYIFTVRGHVAVYISFSARMDDNDNHRLSSLVG